MDDQQVDCRRQQRRCPRLGVLRATRTAVVPRLAMRATAAPSNRDPAAQRAKCCSSRMAADGSRFLAVRFGDRGDLGGHIRVRTEQPSR